MLRSIEGKPLVYYEPPPDEQQKRHQCQTAGCETMIYGNNELRYCGHCQVFIRDCIDEYGLGREDIDFLLSQPDPFAMRLFWEHLGHRQNTMYRYLENKRIRADGRGKNRVYLIDRLHAALITARYRHEISISQVADLAGVPVWFLINVGSIFGIEPLIHQKRLVPVARMALNCFDNRKLSQILSVIEQVYPYWKRAKLEPIVSFPQLVSIAWLATASSLGPSNLRLYRQSGQLEATRGTVPYLFSRQNVLDFLDSLAGSSSQASRATQNKAVLCARRLRDCPRKD